MIEVARVNAAASAAAVDLDLTSWLERLERVGRDLYEAVGCTGNSIVHAGGEQELTAALRSMRSTLRRGGWLLLDSRDW